MNYARVVFPLPQDLAFTYAIPHRLQISAQRGTRVLAPLGRSVREGVITALLEKPDIHNPTIEIKKITDCLDDKPTFSDELLVLTEWMAKYYLSSHGEALNCAVPTVIRSQQRRIVRLLATVEQIESLQKQAPMQCKVLETLRVYGDLSPNQLARRVGGILKLRRALPILEEKRLVAIESDFGTKTKPKSISIVSLAKSPVEIQAGITSMSKRAPKQIEVLQLLLEAKTPIPASQIRKCIKTNSSPLKLLEKKGLIRIESIDVLRNPLSLEPVSRTNAIRVNKDQAAALRAIEGSRHKIFLLHGVTGSGKTEIYMQAISKVIEQGKSTIVLVPEIALTPQTVSRFVGRFGARVAVLHSKLSDGERYDQWHRIRTGEADIVVGPRSAVFAPTTNLGIIVIDEEHETSYKQADSPPRYNAREVAVKRAELANCPLILGSATPSLESFYHAHRGDYHLLKLPSRVENIELPPVQIIDMCQELKQNNRTIFSAALRTAIEDRLAKQEQILLFLNRRGYSSYVFCRTCGYVERCGDCSISLTFHFETKQMVCHHCGDARATSKVCPQCASKYIRYFGLGTQQVEQNAIKTFPQARVVRMDSDSTTRKEAHQQILDAFKSRTIDILVGTQMIAKGLDFPNVTLVGVIAADTALNLPDFRAGERSFNVLTQVAGRSGRGKAGGEVIVQTYMPEHYSIQASQKHDYEKFYQQEIVYRKELLYPPFSHAATILLRGEVEEEVVQTADTILNRLEELRTAQFPEIKIRGPVAAPLSKIMGKFRWHFLLRSKHVDRLRDFIREAFHCSTSPAIARDVDLIVDIDPLSVL